MERNWQGQSLVLIFHVRKGNVSLPGLRGRRNLITGGDFSGLLGDYEAALLADLP